MKFLLSLALMLFLVSCSSHGGGAQKGWAYQAHFPAKPETLVETVPTDDGPLPLEHRFLDQEDLVYTANRGVYPIKVSESGHEAVFERGLKRFLKKKGGGKILSHKPKMLGTHRAEDYRIAFTDHVGEYLFVFDGQSLYIFGVESTSFERIKESAFLQSVKVSN